MQIISIENKSNKQMDWFKIFIATQKYILPCRKFSRFNIFYLYTQFWLVLAIGFDYLCFFFWENVKTWLLRSSIVVFRIPKTNKIINSNFKFEDTHVLGNIHVNILGSKKRSMCPCFCNRLLLEEKLKNRSFCCFSLSNYLKNTKIF